MASKQLRKVFVMESEDRLQQMEEALLQLESDPTDKEAIHVVFRAAHTIKGSAGVVGLDGVSRFMHVVENTLDKVRNGELPVTPELIKLALNCHDLVVEWLAYSADNDEPNPDLEAGRIDLLKQLEAISTAPKASSPPAEATPVEEKTASAEQPVASPKEEEGPDTLLIDGTNLLDAIEQAIVSLHAKDESTPEVLKHVRQCALALNNNAKSMGFNSVVQVAQLLGEVEKMKPAGNMLPDSLQVAYDAVAELCRQVEVGLGELPPPLIKRFTSAAMSLQDCLKPVALSPVSKDSGPVVAHATPMDEADPVVEVDNWHISLRFSEDALRKGIEPLETLHYLGNYGAVVHLSTLFDGMPDAEVMDPEACYLGFELGFKTDLDKTGIENLFDLIQDDCDVHILSPHSQLSHYINLIRELPEDTMKLGEILTQVGTLTQRELDDGLAFQRAAGKQQPRLGTELTPRLGEVLVEHGVVEQEVVNAAVSKQQQIRQYQTGKQRALHVDAAKLDQLIDLVGELVITNAGMKLLTQDINDERLKKVNVMMSRLVEEIRNRSLGMRMIPIGDTFNRFRRLVRDLNASLNKKVELQIIGAETELDKSMVEKINDPLMHLVRNSIDHGIESQEERAAAGKPAQGIVQLNAYHDSGSIVIEVTDDGRGLNAEKILHQAVAKGLAKPEQEYTEQEIYNFIFEPGLSTAETVTQVSGRGVGLDVVKRNLSALNGMINIDTEEGVGTTIQIYLPLTLAIIDGFLLSVGKSSFVVPLDRVIRCVKYTEEFEQEGRNGYINLRGKVLPLLYVHKLFELERDTTVKHRNIVVVRHGNREAGLVVDSLQGEFQAVIKPLGKIFEHMPGISGATILGNGEVALILDVPALVQRYSSMIHSALPKQHATMEVSVNERQLVAA